MIQRHSQRVFSNIHFCLFLFNHFCLRFKITLNEHELLQSHEKALKNISFFYILLFMANKAKMGDEKCIVKKCGSPVKKVVDHCSKL